MTGTPTGDFLLLVDASAYLHRAFHALPRITRRSDGLQTGAIYGFCNALLKLTVLNWTPIGRLPSHAAVILDTSGKNFRHTIFPSYKAQRKPYDEDLKAQLPWIVPTAEAFGLPTLALPGYEADDIIATLVRMAEAERLEVVIASSDKDLGQLVSTRTIMYDALKDKGRDNNAGCIIGIEEVKAKFGVFPWQMVDLQAMVGDTVDNVPGVSGIGPVSAARLINSIGDLDEILSEASWDESRFKNAKEAASIAYSEESIRISRRLVELDQNVPLDIEIDDLFLKPADVLKLRSYFIDMEFMQLLQRI